MKIKILVAFHKPYTLFQNDILVPIHVGRDIAFQKSKDGILSEQDYAWLSKYTIGDNTGTNISNLNRDFCELTATFWAWKNYEQLGSPDYIGLMHYRTFFDLLAYVSQDSSVSSRSLLGYNEEFLSSILTKYDGIISKRLDTSLMYAQDPILRKERPNEDFLHLSEQYYPQLYRYFVPAWHTKTFHYKNMFVLKKEDFFAYCDILFDILFKVHKENIARNFYQARKMGYLAEILSSLIFSWMMTEQKRNFLELPWLIISQQNTPRTLKTCVKEKGYSLLAQLTHSKKMIHKMARYQLINHSISPIISIKK